MVFLSRIYTRSGDQGETSLGDGSRVAKDDPRVCAYGSVDELNAALGLMLAQGLGEQAELAQVLRDIQNDLFDVGGDLCVPLAGQTSEVSKTSEVSEASSQLRVLPEQVERLEKLIDRYNADLQPLKSFVLPGGSPAAAWCHLARTICRRAEREVAALGHSQTINPNVLKYLNRLSDLLFVLARVCNDNGKADLLWVPGKTRSG